jgi:predicted DNA-binding transcriptional regulator AlpA
MTLKFMLAFTGIDLDDFHLLARLLDVLPDVHWGEVDGEVQADVFSRQHSFVKATQHVEDAVRQAAPDARATRLVEDFVAIPDIAKRAHVNRETVRLWSKEDAFPRPRDVVGNGIKIWDWTAVNTWLQREHAGALGDAYRYPTPAETAQVNAFLRQMEFHRTAVETTLATRSRPSSGQWEKIPAVGFGDTRSLRVHVGNRPVVARHDAVAE